MQLYQYIIRRRIQRAIVALVLCVAMLTSTFYPQVTYAASGDVMSNKAFAALAAVIFNLNTAMETAAKNPMDDWRRKNVQIVFSMLPAAIVALADEFKAGKLKDSDFPMVQQMLGSFVNVKAAEGIKRFIDKPDRNLIPKLGNSFPYSLAEKTGVPGMADPRQLVMQDNAKAGANSQDSTRSISFGDRSGLANLNDDTALPASSNSGFKPDDRDFVFTGTTKSSVESVFSDSNQNSIKSMEGWKEQASQVSGSNLQNIPFSGSTESPVKKDKQENFLLGAERDLATLQGQLENKKDIFGEQLEKKKDEKSDGQKEKEKDSKSNEASKRNNGGSKYQLSLEPKFFNSISLFKLSSLMVGGFSTEAHAEGGGEAAGILYGIAAIIAAMMPAIVAGIQAKADVAITKLNTQNQKDLALIAQDTSLKLSSQQAAVAQAQTAATMQMSQQNQMAATDRLQLQLSEIKAARQEATNFESQRLKGQQEMENRRLDFAMSQAQKTVEVAERQYRDALSQSGTLGTRTDKDANNVAVERGLGTTAYGPGYQYPGYTQGATVATNGKVVPNGGMNGFMASGQKEAASNTSLAFLGSDRQAILRGAAPDAKQDNGTAGNGLAAPIAAEGNGMGMGGRKNSHNASDKLLATVDSPSGSESGLNSMSWLFGGAGMASSSSSQPMMIQNPSVSTAVQPGLRAVMTSSRQVIVRGSFRGFRNRLPQQNQPGNSDLKNFLGAGNSPQKFSDYLKEGTPHAIQARTQQGERSIQQQQGAQLSTHAYKAPSMDEAGRRPSSVDLGQMGY